MATPPLDSYIKTPPPTEPDSQFPYLEDQFQRIEGTMSNHTKRIVTVDSNLTTEELTRSNADNSLAQYVTAASVGASNVYTQSTPPTATGRLQGDVWYDTGNSFTPYVWYASAWQNNSTGSYTQYVGQIATINTSLGATKNKVDNTLGVQWSVQATINNSTGGLTFTGLQKADGTGATYNLEITSNVTINGGLLVNGSITGSKIAAGTITGSQIAAGTITADKITAGTITADRIVAGTITGTYLASGTVTNTNLANNAVWTNNINNGAVSTPQIYTNAVSNNAYADTSGSTASASINLLSGDRVSIWATAQGGSSNTGSYLVVGVNGAGGAQNIVTKGVSGFVNSAAAYAGSYSGGYVTSVGFVQNIIAGPATVLTFYTAPATGSYTFTAANGVGGATQILITRLSV